MATLYEFCVGFTKLGVGVAPSSAPTITVVDSANNVLVSAATATTAVTNLLGAYRYSYSGADGLICYAKFTTTDLTVDQYEIFTAALINPIIQNIHDTDLPAVKSDTATILADYARRTGDYSTLAAGAQMDLVNAPNATAIIAIKSGLALEATLTAIKGAGWTTETLAAIDVLIDAIKAKTDELPTITSVAVSATVAASVSTGSMAIEAGMTFRQTVTSTLSGDLSAATKVWLAIKSNARDTDAQSLIFIEKTGGLTVVKGAAYTTIANGSLTISGISGAWNIAAFLDESVTDDLFAYGGTYVAEVKALIGGDTYSVWSGECVVSDGIVRAIA